MKSFREPLSLKDSFYRKNVLAVLSTLYRFDVGQGDITTDLLGFSSQRVQAVIFSRSNGIVAGLEEALFFMSSSFKNIHVKTFLLDGQKVSSDEKILLLEGPVGTILKLERTLLNFLQRMSGIATYTDRFVQIASPSVLITSTRKTLWGLLDKKACYVGGAGTHRHHLGDAVLIKDTHRALFQEDIEKIMLRAVKKGLKGKFLEIEIEDFGSVLEAFKVYQDIAKSSAIFSGWPFCLMLDNMTPQQIKRVVKKRKELNLNNKIWLEASGGITLKNIASYAKTGVEILSIGALTHSAPSLDLSLEIENS